MLAEIFSLESLKKSLKSNANYTPFPKAKERDKWEARLGAELPGKFIALAMEEAAEFNKCDWPTINATDYLEFQRTGNRTHCEKKYFTKRNMLTSFVVAECVEYKGEYLDKIIDGLWQISSEMSWALPAHTDITNNELGDSAEREDIVALFSCETAHHLAMTIYLLEDELNAVVPNLVARIKSEIERRLLSQVEDRVEFPWINSNNNWMPWCASNLLNSALLVLDDSDRLAVIVHRLNSIVDKYMDCCPDDGGCDEGAMYWHVATGMVFNYLERLTSYTGNYEVYQNQKLKRMLEYIVSSHISEDYIVSFCDSHMLNSALKNNSSLHRFGQRVESDRLLKTLDMLLDIETPENVGKSQFNYLPTCLQKIWWGPLSIRENDYRYEKQEDWYPDTQALFVRSEGNRFYVAAKAGHNNESHNHNDVGQFIVAVDGDPIILDLGTEAYTKKTFGPDRYDLWTVRSSGHNVPLINGFEQHAGEEYTARDIEYDQDNAVCRMDISKAYPAEAGINTLVRALSYSLYKNNLVVSDDISMNEKGVESVIPLFSTCDIQVVKPGEIAFAKDGDTQLMLRYPDCAEVTIEHIELSEESGMRSFDGFVNKVSLTFSSGTDVLSYSMEFQRV